MRSRTARYRPAGPHGPRHSLSPCVPPAPRPGTRPGRTPSTAPAGFYRRPEGPAGHFLTSTHGDLGRVFALAVGALADHAGVCRVLDLGCGRGELLTHLHAVRPDLGLTGVDVVERPDGLPDEVDWLRSPGGPGLPDALADLDETPRPRPRVARRRPVPGRRGRRRRDAARGARRPGNRGGDARRPPRRGRPGLGRALVAAGRRGAGGPGRGGPPRDRGVGRPASPGSAPASSSPSTTATSATPVPPAARSRHTAAGRLDARWSPTAACDLTAHVAVDSLLHDELGTQRDALARPRAERRPARPGPGAQRDPPAYLAALADASTVATLTDPGGLGGFWWVLREIPG